jgi:hypothetical protein
MCSGECVETDVFGIVLFPDPQNRLAEAFPVPPPFNQSCSIEVRRLFKFGLFLSLAVLFILPTERSLRAQKDPPTRRKGLFVGVNYPGIVIGYTKSGYDLELRHFVGNEDNLTGARFRKSLLQLREGEVYWALDGYRVNFAANIAEGSGYMAGITFGTEHSPELLFLAQHGCRTVSARAKGSAKLGNARGA